MEWTPRPPAERISLVPVYLEHRREHRFEKKEERRDEKTGRKIQPPGCATCGLAKNAVAHLGVPPSQNEMGSGAMGGRAAIGAYQTQKRVWMALLTDLVVQSGLPKGLGRIHVEGEFTFGRRPGHRGPDQINYVFPLIKALGDALEVGGWIEQDDWTRFTVGEFAYRFVPREYGFALTLHPAWEPRVLVEGIAAQPTLL